VCGGEVKKSSSGKKISKFFLSFVEIEDCKKNRSSKWTNFSQTQKAPKACNAKKIL
jgi:hypothetical protein